MKYKYRIYKPTNNKFGVQQRKFFIWRDLFTYEEMSGGRIYTSVKSFDTYDDAKTALDKHLDTIGKWAFKPYTLTFITYDSKTKERTECTPV